MDPPELPVLPEGYEARELLGEGSQGSTVRAWDGAREQQVAIKVFSLARGKGWKAFELFERESKVLRSLSHPSIPRFVDLVADEAAGRFFLVMEYVPGESLAVRMRRRHRYTDAKLRELLERLLDVLEYLHGLNPPVYHRDIKPANVVLGADGRVTLVDFGGVRDSFRAGTEATVVGTFGYMAPEQLRGDASAGTDLYALGATIAAIASGMDAAELPTEGLEIDVTQTMKPGPIRRAVQAMLKPDPRQRARSVADVRAALEPLPAAPPPPEKPTRAVARRPPATVSVHAESWIDRPLLRTPQFMVPIGVLSGLFAAISGVAVAFPIVFVTLVLIGLPVMKGVRRGMRGES